MFQRKTVKEQEERTVRLKVLAGNIKEQAKQLEANSEKGIQR